MAVRVEKTALPGIGTRHDILTGSGRRIGVISRRGGGRRDLVVSDYDDPDACTAQVPLTDDESDTLAELLGSSVVLSRLSRLADDVEGLFTEQIALGSGSPWARRRLADTQARTRTRASIVAVIRDRDVHPSPGPEFVFADGDVVVAVGTREGLDRLVSILSGQQA
ncbi:cation:proton antiporter regulatory subunit [Rugosimonospora acidiphila]|uniref:Cation:proton antiporter regulatory subunit n=1 Tax=Rugosimonospora acidiphila TaxID=556531 RepID=A0ABP9RRK5_9ACTN